MERLAGRVQRRDFRQPAAAGGSCTASDVVGAYCDYIGGRAAATLSGAPGIRVVVDAGNGCYSHIAPRVLRSLGYDVVELNCEPDGTFPNRDPNPAVPANLARLRGVVQSSRAAMGVGYDGDGDRSVFVDERGNVVDNDRALVLLARLLLRRREATSTLGNEVVYDIKCSSIVADEVRAAGGIPVMERSGHAFIKTTLIERQALFAGEVSGHFFFGELGGDDGLYATALMLQAVAEDGRGLAEMAAEMPRYPITPDLRLPASPQQMVAALAQLQAAFSGDPECEVSLLDGVRVAWPDGWLLARPSVTEPLLTVRAEAHAPERLAEILEVAAGRAPELGRVLSSTF